MVIRQRAVLAEDKQERHHAILDAAERLLARSPARVANVAEVADEAGLAKGTVYLYFPSKEELLLAAHERQADEFFSALTARLAQDAPVTLDELVTLTQEHIVARATFLPLATRCLGMMATEVPVETAGAFHTRMHERLQAAGAGLERHYPELAAGEGVPLLRRSFALIVGLWQLSFAHSRDEPGTCGMGPADFPDELAQALRALWEGTIGRSRAQAGAAEARP
ncbi:MAG: TetR family transcriptional regulator [Betaproteobacteria bacterium]|jgi:AcrR family transcriptional regulator|nr:TetR family transcriptional regulator [Betaproteobacteria bacterium]MDH5285389.1 TetR family transcriptional regulator [Betaproteobacteria bacterium]